MANADNEAIARRLVTEVFEQRYFDVIDDLVHDDYVLHDPSMPEPVRGPDGYREMAEMGASIIDGTIEIDQVISTDDYVVTRWTQRGTHVGQMGRIDPTDEEVTVTGIDINRFEDGTLVETWSEVNLLPMLMQIGEVPEDLFAPAVAVED